MTPTSKIRHMFISRRETALPRWAEAFPGMVLLAPGAIKRVAGKNVLVWLELSAQGTTAEQMTTVRRTMGDHPFIVLNSTPTDDEAIQCFSLGAKAYCNAHSTPDNLKTVADVVLQGGLWLGPSLLQRLIKATARPDFQPLIEPVLAQSPHAATSLSEREREVATAVANGSSNKDIARQLDITERTVKAHVGSIFEKTGVRDRLQLALLLNRPSAG
jgi:DNA-binding NarL/FixJ family response regulator